MTNKLKVLGLALVAVFAMSAVAASAASANQFMSEGGGSTTVTATQVGEHVFTVDGASVTCEVATFSSVGEVASPATSVKVSPNYEECTAFTFFTAKIQTEGCYYNLHVGATGGIEYTGSLDLECEEGHEIVIAAGTCEAKVAGGQEFSGIGYANAEGGKVTIAAEVAGIAVNKTKDGFLCPFSGKGAAEGTYEGTTLAAGGSDNITVEMS